MDPGPAREDRSGALVGGKYRLVRLLGRGGMGAVYEAENTWTRRRVAMKLLRPEYARDKEALRRFMQEAQSASQIAHPHIIDVLDLGLENSDGSLYMVQELLQGEDLRARLKAAGKLPATEALAVMVPILGALAAAHEHGVVHRDIKPENIFLTKESTGRVMPKLIDFGVSKVLEPGQTGAQTGAGTALGTPRYMAPEQLRGEPDVDARADVWSVGVVLYELLSGGNPFEAPTAFGSANRVLNETVAPLPGLLGEIVSKTMQPLKRGRPANARELLQEVLKLDEARGLDERYASAIVRRKPEERPAPQPVVFELMSQLGTLPTLPAPETPTKRKFPILALALVVAGGVAVAAWRFTRVETIPPPPVKVPVVSVVDAAVAPSPVEIPVATPKKHPVKPPSRPTKPNVEEGTNRAPIVE
jgi:serine/threonine-protein kinase